MKKSAIFLSLLGVALIAGLFFYLRDTSGPQFTASPEAGPVSEARPINLELQDKGSGLKSVRVTVSQKGKVTELLNKTFDPGTVSRGEEINFAGAGLEEGPLEVHVTAVDRSIYPLGSGSTTEKSFTYDFDNRAPVISVMTNAHNINQGGAGLVLYKLSEEPARTGVTVGDFFFPGYRLEGDVYASLFAWPWNMKSAEFKPRLMAVDAAGNERQGGFYYHANAKNFPRDKINVSDGFLQEKMPEFETMYPGVKDPLQLFLKVNGELREQNVRSLHDFAGKTEPRPLWSGSFVRQLGAPRGFFAQGRTYHYNGQEVDQATHLGVDIAGLAQMPVVAANSGKVIFTDYLGIYGNTVIIDHGLGLQSLYAHLSQFEVKPGDTVEKGQTIARSGATGMAGGDHLHFGMLVSGLEVIPLEWWDSTWLTNNITSKLELVSGKTAQK